MGYILIIVDKYIWVYVVEFALVAQFKLWWRFRQMLHYCNALDIIYSKLKSDTNMVLVLVENHTDRRKD